MNITHTGKGFAKAEFLDRNEVPCSLQKSSIATEDCIWLGADDIGLSCFEAGKGWNKVILDGVRHVANNRMHLSRANVQALLPLLKHFALTGDLPAPEPRGLPGPVTASVYEEGDAQVVRVGEIRLEDGEVFLGALLTFPAGPPSFTFSVVWKGTPMTLAVKGPS